MKRFKLRMGLVVFLLYSGIAILEIVRTKNWVAVAYFGILGLVFLLLDSSKRLTAQR